MTTVERPLGLDKQTLNAFKNKFEKMDTTLESNLEERLQSLKKNLEGLILYVSNYRIIFLPFFKFFFRNF